MANDEKPDPLDDVKKGLGLLFRAAKTAAQKLPTQPLEKVVLDGAREVGRAVENVTQTVASTIEKQVFGKDGKHKDKHVPSVPDDTANDETKGADASTPAGSKPGTGTGDAKHDEPKPRVG